MSTFEETTKMAMDHERNCANEEEIIGSSAYFWFKDGHMNIIKFLPDVHPRNAIPRLLEEEQPEGYIWIGEAYNRVTSPENPRTHIDLSLDPQSTEVLIAIVKQRGHDAVHWKAPIYPDRDDRCGEWEEEANGKHSGAMMIEDW